MSTISYKVIKGVIVERLGENDITDLLRRKRYGEPATVRTP